MAKQYAGEARVYKINFDDNKDIAALQRARPADDGAVCQRRGEGAPDGHELQDAHRGDAACKQQLLQRLRDLERANHWVMRPLHWDGKAGSLVGSLLRSEDLDAWETDFGLSKWLALALDGVFAAAPGCS